MEENKLIGMWFVSRENGNQKWQGQIVEQVDKSLYIAQLYSWIDGGATNCVLVKVDDIISEGWELYRNNKAFQNRG